MGKLSTHVLDTTRGRPGNNIAIAVYRVEGSQRQLVTQAVTNHDGRCDAPLLQGDALAVGVYEVVLSVGPYFATYESADSKNDTSVRFLSDVVIRFGVPSADEHYHVPLLISPYSYSTYRGS